MIRDLFRDSLGISPKDISATGTILFSEKNDAAFLIQGDFDLGTARESLQKSGFLQSDERRVEVWRHPAFGVKHITEVAFTEDIIMAGFGDGIKNSVEVVTGDSACLGKDANFVSLIDRTPNGVTFQYEKTELPDDNGYDGLESWGISIAGKDEQLMTYTRIFRFETSKSGSVASGQIESDMINSIDLGSWIDLHVNQDGEFVVANADMGMADYVGESIEKSTDPMNQDLFCVRIAMTALKVEHQTLAVDPQTAWTNDVNVDIVPGSEHGSLADYMLSGERIYYYQWNNKGALYQCEDSSCPNPF